MEEIVIAAKQKARHDMTLGVRNTIFACAAQTQSRFTHIIHQRVALAHARAVEKARLARAARLHAFAPVAPVNSTKNITKNVTVPRLESERQTLVRLLKEAMNDVVNARTTNARNEASARADDLRIRLEELDELVEARNAVSNGTESRASAGTSGNQTMIEHAEAVVNDALHNLSIVLARQYARRHPKPKIRKNHTDPTILFMKKCMGNDTHTRLANATQQVFDVPTTQSIHELVVAKSAMRTKKRVCRLKYQIKTAMVILKKTTDKDDRKDIKSEIKSLAHKIAMLTNADQQKAKQIL